MASLRRFQWIEDSRLWLVLDRDAAAPRSLAEATELCIEGGVDAVVFRMKDAAAAEAFSVAREVREVCRQCSVPFVLSHFSGLVDELQPDALHLGKEDAPLAEIQSSLQQDTILGYSAHSLAEAQEAINAGAGYLFLGPIFETPSKARFGPALGTEVIAQATGLQSAIVFIGGMNELTIPLAVKAGAKRVAAISALLSTPDPRAAARRLRALLPY